MSAAISGQTVTIDGTIRGTLVRHIKDRAGDRMIVKVGADTMVFSATRVTLGVVENALSID